MPIILDNVSYTYDRDSGYGRQALKDINLVINKGEFIGLIGHTGSGKSTLTQLLNGLLQADGGNVYFDGQDIYEKGYDLKKLRSRVGLVFQYPEHQLFESTVFKDVCFGPKNMGLTKKEYELRAFKALEQVGIPPECYYSSPLELSGGQKRRVAIAGILAMEPEYLVLDEPAAGLDPAGRDEILGLINDMHKKRGMTVILVSHNMEDVALYADRILVMNEGEIVFDDTPTHIFTRGSELEAMGLMAPQVTYLMKELRQMGFAVNTEVITKEDCVNSILRALKRY